jgi:hypothetical protein
MKRGDQVFIMCTVVDSDDKGDTVWITAMAVRDGEQVMHVSNLDVVVRASR